MHRTIETHDCQLSFANVSKRFVSRRNFNKNSILLIDRDNFLIKRFVY
jgi:hypothetical protein